jgi:hypothetical protein
VAEGPALVVFETKSSRISNEILPLLRLFSHSPSGRGFAFFVRVNHQWRGVGCDSFFIHDHFLNTVHARQVKHRIEQNIF